MIKFTITGTLPTLNKVNKANRTHWSKGARLKKEYEDLIKWQITRVSPVADDDYPVVVAVRWFDPNNKRDADNVIAGNKMLLDAMVAMEILRDDSRKYVENVVSLGVETDAKNPRIEVFLFSRHEARKTCPYCNSCLQTWKED